MTNINNNKITPFSFFLLQFSHYVQFSDILPERLTILGIHNMVRRQRLLLPTQFFPSWVDIVVLSTIGFSRNCDNNIVIISSMKDSV